MKETPNARVKIIRKKLNLSQELFGARIGVKKSAISKIENGENNLTDQMAKLIQNEFNVDYFWLTQGIGDDMFVEQDGSDIELITRKYGLDELSTQIAIRFLKLSNEERKMMIDVVTKLFGDIGDNNEP